MSSRWSERTTARVVRAAVRPRRIGLCAAAALLLPFAAEAGAQDLRYSLTPVGQRVLWDDELGLANGWLYGGRVGFLFGDWIELQGFYLRSADELDTRFGAAGVLAPGGGALDEGRVDVDNYGADVVVNLGPWRLRPFVRAGGSVLRFDPQGGERTSQIALRAGGGIRFGNPGQLRLQLYAEDLAFRLNRYRLTPGEDGTLPTDADGDEVRHNLVYGAGLTIPLGGGAGVDDRPRFGVGGASLPIELFGGVLNFDDDDDLDGQNLLGVRTGVDFGRYVGLRGFYWRGVNDDFDGTRPIQGWGGEAQFNLNAGPGIAPYLVAGAGKLDFRSGFTNDAGAAMDDRTVLILGGGASVRLSDRVRLNASARNYLSSPDESLEDVSRTDDLRGNWLFSAGLGFNIGGSTPGAPMPRAPRLAVADTVRTMDTVYVDTRTGERVRQPGRTRMVARADTMPLDTVFVDRATGERVRGGEVELPARAREGFVSGQTTTIPVPTQGEIYIRYGPARDSAAAPVPGQAMDPRMMPRMAPGMQRDPYGAMAPEAMRQPLAPAELREAIRSVIRDELTRQQMELELQRDPAMRGVPPTAPAQPMPQVQPPQPVPQAQPGQPAAPPAATPRVVPSVKERPMDMAAVEARIMARVDQLMAAQAGRDSAYLASARATTDPDLLRQLEERQVERERRMLQEIERIVTEQVRREMERVRTEERAEAQAVPAAQPPTASRTTVGQFTPQAWSAYGGATVSEGGQAVLGARVNLGPFLAAVPALDLVPEVAVGFGSGGTSTLLAANAQYWFGRLGTLQPYVGAGLGLMNFSDEVGSRDGLDLVVNPSVGSAWTFGGSPLLRAAQFFVEYQGLDWFDLSRVNAGLRWDRTR